MSTIITEFTIIVLIKILVVTANHGDKNAKIEEQNKLIKRLNKTNNLMFEQFAEDQLNYHDILEHLIDSTALGHEFDHDTASMTKNALDSLEKFQKKLTLIGIELRHHKFVDLDRRSDKARSISSFPDPVFDTIRNEIEVNCEESVEKCVKFAAESF